MKSVPGTTLVFATMDRPHAVERFVHSIRARFPDLPICVADQTVPTAYMRRFYDRQRVDVHWVPHDMGVGACRNFLVEKTTTPLVFMCDDDLVFTDDTDFTACLEILKHDPEVGIIGGQWLDKYGDAPEFVRPWAIFLELNRERKTLTGIPAYHYFPEVRHVGVHKYFLCDTALNFSFIRRDVFRNEKVRWDARFKCNGEHEDFYLNFKTASDYLVAFYPGLVCRHRRPPAPAYELLRDRAEGWRLFMEKWGIEQYCELDNGTRIRKAPGKVHKDRDWEDYLSSVGVVPENEWGDPRFPVSLTDDMQVILATHFDRETGAPIESRRSSAALYLDASGQLISAGGEAESEDPEAEKARALDALRNARQGVTLRFRCPPEVQAGDEIFLFVEVENTGGAPVVVGSGSLFEGAFSCSFRRGDAWVSIDEDATACFADLPLGTHEQLVRVRAPTVPGIYELSVRLTAGGALVLGAPATSAVHVKARTRRETPSSLGAGVHVDSEASVPAAIAPAASASALLDWIRRHVRVEPLERVDSDGPTTLLSFALECEPPLAITELLLTHHLRERGEYVAWDVHRQPLRGLRSGRQVRALIVDRGFDTRSDIEVAAVVPDAGYVPLFRLAGAELQSEPSRRMLISR